MDNDRDDVQRLRVRLQVVEEENRLLHDTESTYRFVAENTTDAIIMINPESQMLFVNHATEEVFGYTRAEMIGQSVTMLMPEPYRVRHLVGIARYLATGVKHLNWDFIEFPGLKKDGKEIPLALAYRESVRDGQHLFLGAIRDITARKEAEDALSREHAFLLSAIEILPFPFFIISSEAKIIQANRASYDLLQEPEIERWWDIDLLTPDTRIPIPPDERPGMLALHGKLQRSTEWIMTFPDGRQVPVLIHAAPVYVEAQLVAAVVAVQDISAIKEADRAKDEFLAFTSHDVAAHASRHVLLT